MPLNRYQIRKEYSLADPELYKAADKDDPEALLEGVAMAGLVGVLRQLGDLAEFAAEIFHDLHEEVMATAARGHSLTVRVQQLEAEFPLIERAFLSQTNHSSFFYNTGTDWHPSLRMDQNLVTQGDLPRFVMDSYEECRGPPRLFLLDKFDVAGAGACLKRYTDPSCFKVETSSYAFTTSDVQRDKRTRKMKKRGSRWRNGETPEVLPISHAKLHQLFLEERIENGIKVPAHRVKLKRKLNGFPFDPKTGKSYMNKFLEVSSPEHRVVHEICVDSSSPLILPSSDAYEILMDTEDVAPLSPDKDVLQRDRRASSSPSPLKGEESYALKPCLDDVDEDPSHDKVQEISRPRHNSQTADILHSTHSMVDEKEIAVDGERQTEGSIGYESDDVASEIDKYVDALATMESELDTDSEQRAKRNSHFLNSKRQVFSLSSNSEKLQAQSSDSHSMENSTLSDDGNSYSRKEISSFSCSDSHIASDESVLLESEMSCKVAKTFDTSYDQQAFNEETRLPQPREDGDSDTKCIMVAGKPRGSCDSAVETTTPSLTDSTPMPVHAYAGIFVGVAGMRAETSESFISHDKSEMPLASTAGDTTNLNVSSPGAPVILNAPEQHVDDSSSRASIEGKLADDGNFSLGENVSVLYPSDVPYHASGNALWSKSPEIQHENRSDDDHMNLANYLPFTPESLSGSSQDRLHSPDGEDPSLGEDSTCIYNTADSPSSKEDDISPSLLATINHSDHPDGFDNENSNGTSGASVQMLYILGASEKECDKNSSLTMSHYKTAEHTCTINSCNLTTTEIEAGSEDEEHEEICGAFSDAVTSEQGDLNKNCGVDGTDFLDVLNPRISEFANDVQPVESAKEDISWSMPENPVEALSRMEFEEKGNTTASELLSARTSTGLTSSPHSGLATIDRSDITDGTASLSALAKGNEDDTHSSLYHENLSEESDCIIVHSSQNELELDHVHLPDSLTELNFEKLIADSPDSNSFVHDTSNYHHPESEVRDTLSDNEFSFGAENTCDMNAALSRPPFEIYSLDAEQVSSESSKVVDSTEDASVLQTVLQEAKDELEDNQFNEELGNKADVNMDQSPLMEQIQPSNHADGAFDASSLSLLANLPSEVAAPEVLGYNNNEDPQPSLTDYHAEEGADSAIYEHDKMEVLDSGEAMSEPLILLAQPQQLGSFELQQSAQASSISLSMLSCSPPSFPELLSQNYQDKLPSLPTLLPDKEEDDLASKELDKERLIDEGIAEQEFDEAHLSNHADIVGALNDSSMPSIADVPSQTSLSNPSSFRNQNVNPFEHGNTVVSTAPSFVLLPGEPQIDLEEMPPLPPLPPMQWRMGKVHSSPDLHDPTPHHIGANLSVAPRNDQNPQPVNQNMALLAISIENTEPVDNVAQSGQYHEVQQPRLHTIREETESANATSLDKLSIHALGSSDLIQPQNQVAPELLSEEQGSGHLEGDLPMSDGIKPEDPLDTALTDASRSLCHEPPQPQLPSQSQHHQHHQLAPETSSNRSNLEEMPTSLERNVVIHDTSIPSPYAENEKPDHSIPTSEAEIIWPAVEEGNANGIRTLKLQRPRTPLIDDLAAHDKSKLRKVTERVRPEIETVNERDSLLEQIRKKSFNLKPTVATRPSIQGPQTNLRVAAILEKAKTIRQAFAGSDEEDEDDSWSDS